MRVMTLLAAVALGVGASNAQFYEIANQLPQLIKPALLGGGAYRGYVELSGTAGFGDARTNFFGVSTSQGIQYSNWFFMGVGLGVDVATSPNTDKPLSDNYPSNYYPTNVTRTKAMLPVFTDFRFNIGDSSRIGFFADVKIGAAWFLGSDYLQLAGDRIAYMGNGGQFFLKPQIGVRIPVSQSNSKQAVNIGLTYQLITSNNNWNSNSVTLNSAGLTLGYEW